MAGALDQATIDVVVPIGVAPASPTVSVAEGSARPPEPSLADVPGSIGRYVLQRVLGMGGMGVVYQALDTRVGRAVALKLLLAEDRADQRQRIRREAQALARVNHPNVVSVFDTGMVGDRVFIAMELIRGTVLRNWQRDPTRTHDEILDAYAQAGRGLIAAHEVGLVHRDFKPDNVMIGDDGSVKVLDFGLVCSEGQPSPEHPTEDMAPPSGAGPEASLTRTGRLLGTPAYMAPEQQARTTLSPATDQYAFCVALYEALSGEHPFEGYGLDRIERWSTMPVVLGRLPKAVGRALVRGMAPLPELRWPTMDHLLQALQHARTHRWQRPTLLVTAIAFAGGMSAMLGSVTADSACERGAAQLDAIWSRSVRDAIGARFTPDVQPYAIATWDHTRASLDGYAAAWIDTYRSQCEAEDPATIDLAMACLEQRRSALEHTVSVLRSAEPTDIARVQASVERLPSVAPCGDAEALDHEIAPPVDDAVGAAVSNVRAKLDRARAMLWAGMLDPALAEAHEGVRAAEAIAYPPVRAEAGLVLGLVQLERAEHAEAGALLEQAYFDAQSSDHDRVVAEAALGLARLHGIAEQEYDKGRWWVDHARAAADRVADPRLHDASSLIRARIFASEGDYPRAENEFRAILERPEADAGDLDPARARTRVELGRTIAAQGRFDDALVELHRARSLLEAAFGRFHPEIARILDLLAEVHHQRGEYDRALALSTEALELQEAMFPPHHPNLATAHASMGRHLFMLGRVDEFVTHTRKALEIAEIAYGPDSPAAAVHLGNLANVMVVQGDLDGARDHYQRVVDIFEAAWGPEHPLLLTELTNMGIVERLAGERPRAIEMLQRALKLADEQHGPTSLQALFPACYLATVLVEHGELDEAARLTARATEIGDRLLGAEHPQRACIDFAVAVLALARNQPSTASDAARRILQQPNSAAAPVEFAEARAVLGAALRALGDERAASTELAQARAFFTGHPMYRTRAAELARAAELD